MNWHEKLVKIPVMPTLKRPDERWGSVEDVERWYRREKDMNLKQKLNAVRLLMKGRQRNEAADVPGRNAEMGPR